MEDDCRPPDQLPLLGLNHDPQCFAEPMPLTWQLAIQLILLAVCQLRVRWMFHGDHRGGDDQLTKFVSFACESVFVG